MGEGLVSRRSSLRLANVPMLAALDAIAKWRALRRSDPLSARRGASLGCDRPGKTARSPHPRSRWLSDYSPDTLKPTVEHPVQLFADVK